MNVFRSARTRIRLFTAPVLALGIGIAALTPGSAGASSPPAPEGPQHLATVDPIPVDGYGAPGLGAVATAVQDYMRSRCAGAVVVGIGYQGVPLAEWGFGRTNGRASLPILDPACGDDTTDPYDSDAENVDQHAELRLGSISKPISAAVLRWALKERYQQLTGSTLTDAGLEAMPVLGDDFPGGLLPPELRDLLAGVAPLPAETTYCDDLDGAADPRWAQVTVGHLLAHRAGLTKSSPDVEETVTPLLPLLRGLDTPEEFAAEDAAARAGTPVATVDAARAALDDGGDGDISFVRPPTTVEVLKVQAGRCLEFEADGKTYTVGNHYYSNISPIFWGVIMEHVTGVPFASAPGDPASHEGSLIEQFFASELGLDSSAGSGVFRQPASIDDSEPVVINPRQWNAEQGTTRPEEPDDKRPHCRLVGTTCAFTEWDGNTRANWDWVPATVPFDRAGFGVGATQGGMMISPRFMLEFMRDYWVGGYGSDPMIGEPRNGVWDQTGMSHDGAMDGTRAIVRSYSGRHDAEFAVPAVGDDGRLTDDFDHLVPGSFSPPEGLDLFVAVNQSSDPKCQASAALLDVPQQGGGLDDVKLPTSHYTCQQAYGMLEDFVEYGLAQVDWDAVIDAVNAPNAELNIPLGPQSKSATFG